MIYSDSQLIQFKKRDVLPLPADARLRWYALLQVKHRELVNIVTDLAHLIHPDNPARVVVLIGMTGIGKTTLGVRLLNTMLTEHWRDIITPTDIPYIFIKAPANGEKSFSWKAIYRRILAEAGEVLIDKKRQVAISDDAMKVIATSSGVSALRESVEAVFKYRNVRLLAIDEAVHTLRFDSYDVVMDTLKSLADVDKAKILLIGPYDLVDLATNYGQVSRRSEILHYKRYHMDVKEDRDEFRRALVTLQDQWPTASVPNFVAIWRELAEVTLGSIGLLKSVLLNALQLQLNAPSERWTPRFLAISIKSTTLIENIKEETVAGEEKLKGVTFGETLFASVEMMDRLTKKMEVKV